jgi:hypothetical protein
MLTKGLIIGRDEYIGLWDDFITMLCESLREMDEDERAEILGSRDKLEAWLEEQVVEMFDSLLESYEVDVAMVYIDDRWYDVWDGKEFYYLSYRKGDVKDVIEDLMIECGSDIKESRRRYYK